VEFATGLLTAILSAVTFILVLWTIGGALTFTIAKAVPGHFAAYPACLK
jgi:putative ATP-binding cassette transporter